MNETIRIWAGGGGGWGDPLERDPAMVAQDVAAELLSPERARSVYGVVVTNGEAQPTATQTLRASMGAQRSAPRAFDFGPGRGRWEATYGTAAEQIADWLPKLAEGVRRHAQAEVYRQLQSSGSGPYDAAATQQAIQLVEAKLPRSGRLHHE
jgi:hypothetical protein